MLTGRSQEVEISLRIPNMKVRPLDENGYPIDHSTVRFKKLISVPSIPKPGDPFPLTTASGARLESTVVKADWDEHGGRFVVACQYANRSIPQDEYAALMNDPAWRMTPLI
jgi:hypothetical protein